MDKLSINTLASENAVIMLTDDRGFSLTHHFLFHLPTGCSVKKSLLHSYNIDREKSY